MIVVVMIQIVLIRLANKTMSSKKNDTRTMRGFIPNLWMRRCDDDGGDDNVSDHIGEEEDC